MKADRKDYFNKIFVGVLILHIIFIYLMPGLKKIVIEKPKINKITIGINNFSVDTAPKKKKEESKEVSKRKKEITRKKIEKVKPKEIKPKKVEKKQEIVKPQKKILQTTQSFDDAELLTAIEAPREIAVEKKKAKSKIVNNIEEDKKIKVEERKLNEVDEELDTKLEKTNDIQVKSEIADENTNKIDIENDLSKGVEDVKWDTMMSEDNPNIVGPKSGLKVGSIDGKSRVIWASSNKDPEYPLEAEKNAQTADVKIIVDVDADGNVSKVKLIKTGVDVIDRAVEKIARTWNIKLINNGMAVSGSVMVEYKFKLKGRE